MIAKALIEKNKILEAMKFLKKSTACKPKNFRMEFDLTIGPGSITLSTIQVSTNGIECITSGRGEATFSLMGFLNVLKTYPEKELEIGIYDQKVKLENFSFKANTKVIDENQNYRKILLPLNCTDLQILRLPYENYTPDEIDFNELTGSIKNAERRLKRRINKVARDFYKEYSIDEDELKGVLTNMVNKKIKKIK